MGYGPEAPYSLFEGTSEVNVVGVLRRYRGLALCYPLVVLAVAVAIGVLGVMRSYAAGPLWDTGDYLTNALFFRGAPGVEYVTLPIRPPLLSLVSAALFSVAGIDEVVLFAIDACMYVVGVGVFYALLSVRFSSPIAAAGAVLYACSLPLLTWVAVGYTDIFSITMALLMLYATILSFHRHPAYAVAAWVLGVLMVLARHTTPLLLAVPVFYALFSWSKGFAYRYHAYGALAALGVYTLFSPFLSRAYGGPLTYLGMILSRAGTAYNDPGAESVFIVADQWYYVKAFDNLVVDGGPFALVFIALVLMGLFAAFIHASWPVKKYITGPLSAAFVFLASLYLAPSVSFVTGSVLIFVLLFMLGRSLNAHERHDLALDLSMAFWFFLSLSYFSHVDVKVVRFMIMFLPPVYYFAALALSGLSWTREGHISTAGRAAMGAMLLIACYGATSALEPADIVSDYGAGRYASSPATGDLLALLGELAHRDPSYGETTIYAAPWTLASWFLKKTVRPVDPELSSDRLEYELQMYGAAYLIDEPRSLSSFVPVASSGGLALHERSLSWERPEVLYIGRNLENYIGEVLSFEIFVKTGEHVVREFSSNVGDYTLSDLQSYDAVLLYHFSWDDYAAMEQLLATYVEQGGTLFVGGCGNMRENAYSLDKRILFGVTMMRKPFVRDPRITLDPRIAGAYDFSPFVSEGGTWYAMTYLPGDGVAFEPLAMAGNNILVAEQRLGEGKVVWLGGNIVYHAFVTYNLSERAFVRDVFLDYVLHGAE